MIKISGMINGNNNTGTNLIKGCITSICITLISLIIYACFLTFTSISEDTIPTVTIIISMISILIGSSICISKVKKNGIVNGIMISIIYIGIIYFFSSIMQGDFGLNIKSIIMIITSIISGATGGIIGVNKK